MAFLCCRLMDILQGKRRIRMNDKIKIIEYSPEYAAAVAHMWNNSHEGWGGSDLVMTEQQVADEEANSENINVYLAVEGEKVLGYCSLANYVFDDNTMYIPLLNVRSDQHGKKNWQEIVAEGY